MFVIVVGGGKTGDYLTRQLLDEGHIVRLIEQRSEVAERLQYEIRKEVVIAGDGSSPSILHAAGVEDADVLAAVTGDDEANLVVSNIARFEFKVPRIIARVNNPRNAWLYTADMGVDVAVNQTDILANLIVEEMSLGDMMTLLKLRRGEYSLVEEKLASGSKVLGIPLRDLDIPKTCVIAAVIRKGNIVTPRGNLVFQEGDEVLAVVNDQSREDLSRLFATN